MRNYRNIETGEVLSVYQIRKQYVRIPGNRGLMNWPADDTLWPDEWLAKVGVERFDPEQESSD